MIIEAIARVRAYEHRILPAAFLDLMKEQALAHKQPNGSTALKLFECYCEITQTPFKFTTLSQKKFKKIIMGFVGALLSSDFVDGNFYTRDRWIKTITNTLNFLRRNIPGMPDPIVASDAYDDCKGIWREQAGKNFQHLDPMAVRYWQGWKVTYGNGTVNALVLQPLWFSHGPQFTEDFYVGWRNMTAKYSITPSTELNRFVDFIARNKEAWPAEAFQDPVKLKFMFITWKKEYATVGLKENRKMLQEIWNMFVSKIESAFIKPGLWATPFTALPRYTGSAVENFGTKIRKNKRDELVQDQLLTEVPLHVTDNEAIEIIFKKLKGDIQAVRSWAQAQADDLYSRAHRRINLAKRGQVLLHGKRDGIFPELLDDKCATFEHCGFTDSTDRLREIFGYATLKEKLAFDLGIPTKSTLLPYQCLLVSEHPNITPHYLYGLELYNKRGVLSGFLPTDNGHQLIGFKDRRGPELSEIKIDLTEKSAKWVQEIIEITTPLRTFLRDRNDDRWRMLFLTTGAAFRNPSPDTNLKHMSAIKYHPKLAERVLNQFEPFVDLRGDDLKEFVSRICLSRIRASCGVAIYLESRDVKQMAKALGHAKHSADLLAHYLPEPILAFFESRWVRIFQRGMICLAMEGSPFFIEAMGFATMEELHTFLENHAIKEIPTHLENPEHIREVTKRRAHIDNGIPRHSTMKVQQLYIQVDPGMLTTLLSLEQAVDKAEQPSRVSGKARYWAEFSKMVCAEIDRDNDGLLKAHLHTAKNNADPTRMEALMYAA